MKLIDGKKILKINDKIALRDKEGFLLAIMTIESHWKIDKNKESEAIYGTKDKMHPGVSYLFNNIFLCRQKKY